MSLVYLDTCIFIDAFETAGERTTLLRNLFKALQRNAFAAATSEITLAELLAPVKNINAMTGAERRAVYVPFFDKGSFIETIPVSRSILLSTASLREKHPHRLPDAIHIATALEIGCSFYMSQDKDACRLPPSLTWVEQPDAAGIATVLEALRA